MDEVLHTYLALGDSYTVGESVTEDEGFPAQTINILRQQNLYFEKPEIIAGTGWLTHDLLNSLYRNPPQHCYSVVTLLIGINNQYQGKSLHEYKIEFSKLTDMAISYTGNNQRHVFVLSIPDYSVTPFAAAMDTAKISRQVDAFNDVNRTVANEAGLHYLDVTSFSRDAKSHPDLIARDGLHPSGSQYKKWSELLAAKMLLEFQ
jgi:lysophospholipase L1-like esterase